MLKNKVQKKKKNQEGEDKNGDNGFIH